MKINNLYFVLPFIFLSILFISCEKNDSINISEVEESITQEEAIALVEAEDITVELDALIDDFFIDDFLTDSKSTVAKSDENNHGFIPDCAIRTVVESGTSKIVTLDFGEGCQLPNGTILAGKIIMSYVYEMEPSTILITHTFDGFSFNNILVEGENIINKTRENNIGNPESTKTISIKITWPDGEFISKRGTKTREWIAGYDTKNWGDDVFLITGSGTNIFKDGTECSVTIIEPLRKEMSCRFIVSGIMEISKGDRSGVLNFGDGTCDNIAVFTDNEGIETEIVLKKRMGN
ncbi:hypothetical protein BX611_0252 [Lutibacter oceani]|uniref:Uncharacterized protein n=1 Tax=Lutibacter oceani TaxID=1853311 RepID=A0A3D9S298_9FLAO|nr:hypothetical protein [Lutibacter oceani]REE82975.1 hypothetical protein BX611_0252 [Lutibacter oceani]